MNKNKLIKILKNTLPLLLGVFFVYYSISSSSPEERQTLWNNISNAKPIFICISLLFGVLSHLSRAYRWKYLLEPLGYKPKLSTSFMSIMAGYLANLGIPRSGEILRAATTASYDNMPFQKVFGTIISERVADLVMLLLVVLLALILQYEQLIFLFNKYQINPIWSIVTLILVVIIGCLALLLIKKSTSSKFSKIRNFLNGIFEGIVSIFKMKQSFYFIFHTVFIWVMYIAMFWIIKYAIPSTESLSFSTLIIAFIIGSFAISVTNGGIGVFPILIGAVLIYFGIPKHNGEAFGWLVWGTQTFLNLILGSLSLLFLPVLNKK